MWKIMCQILRCSRRRKEPTRAPAARMGRAHVEMKDQPTAEQVAEALKDAHSNVCPYRPAPPASGIDRWLERFGDRAVQRGDEYHRKKIAEMLAEAGIEPLDPKDEG